MLIKRQQKCCLRRGVKLKKKYLSYYVVSLLLAVLLVACNGGDDNKRETIVSEQEASGEVTTSSNITDKGDEEEPSNSKNDVTEGTTEQPTEEETFSQPEIDLIMVGDVLLHDRLEACVKQEDGSYRYEFLFEPMKDEIQAADLAIVNQEVLIGGAELGISGYPCFNADFTLGDATLSEPEQDLRSFLFFPRQ